MVEPPALEFTGRFDRAQLLVFQVTDGQRSDRSGDLTSVAAFKSLDEKVVAVDERGTVSVVGAGATEVQVTVGGVAKTIRVTVNEDTAAPSFNLDIKPILVKAGCAAAACHAAQHGQAGFKLSVFGFDPPGDHREIFRDETQRRISLVDPRASLLLRKPTMRIPHGGGRRLTAGTAEYNTLLAWITGGAPVPNAKDPEVAQLHVAPAVRVAKLDDVQQLRVEAEYADGRRRDITALAKYDSLDDGVVAIDSSGRATIGGRGQAAVMIRYEGAAATALFVSPYSKRVELAGWRGNNFVDELAEAKFRELGLEPSELCDDATFVRRAFLDCIGGLPTPEETRQFLQSTDADKRAKLVDRLLGLTGDPAKDIYTDRYAAFWTLKWSDLIRNNSNSVGEQGMWSLHNWVRESFRVNKPFDKFVRELVTAKGSIYMHGPANYFRINKDSSTLTEATSQLFLGVRLECAKCHHHPFEKFSQADYYGLAAFFARVGSKNSEEFGLFGRETVIVVRSSGDVRHPRTGKTMRPTPLGGEPVEESLDRRLPLADWLTSKENEYFARSIVNRYMAYLLGRGLVEPIDDIRATNPASNAALMDALADHFAKNDFNIKQVIRAIMTSRLYQLSSQPTEQNIADRRFYSHYKVKRLAAEPLLDAVDFVTGSPTKFKNLPLGTRAIELPDAEYPNYFLTTFAKPRRVSVCECERVGSENLAQALHTLNGDTLAKKIADKKGRLATWIGEKKTHDEIVENLFVTTLCRAPSDSEKAYAKELTDSSEKTAQAYEDLLWALMNSKQFLFVY